MDNGLPDLMGTIITGTILLILLILIGGWLSDGAVPPTNLLKTLALPNWPHPWCGWETSRKNKLQNAAAFWNTSRWWNTLTARTKGAIDLQIQWNSGHKDFQPNEKADLHAKKAAKGDTSQIRKLLKVLQKSLPLSIVATHQVLKTKIQHKWLHRWKCLPHYYKICAIDQTTPWKKWLKLVFSLSQAQASLILQLKMGHIRLNKHLHQIKHAPSPFCPNCAGNTTETIHHFLFECTWYWQVLK